MKKVAIFFVAAFLLYGGRSQAYTGPDQAIDAGDYPAAELLLRARLKQNVGQADDRFLLARVLAWQERYAEALQQYDSLLSVYPGHADYMLGKSQTLFWQGRFDEALNNVNLALATSPDYAELWMLKIKILIASGDEEQARISASQAEHRLSSGNLKEIRRLVTRPIPAEQGFKGRREVETGLSYEYLSDDYDHWASLYVRGELFYRPHANIYAQARLVDRFAETDQEVVLGAIQPLGSIYSLEIEASGSPSHEVLAEYTVLAGLSRPIGKDWHVSLRDRYSFYPDTYSNMLSLTGSYYYQDKLLAYTVYASKVEDASGTFSHRLQWRRFYGQRSYFGLYLATGKETEKIGEVAGHTRFLTSSVFGYGLFGQHWFNDGHWAFVYQLWQHDQGNIYSRWGGQLGFRIQF